MYKSSAVKAGNMEVFGLQEGDLRLTEEDSRICDGPISVEECHAALKEMARNKAPGITGFTSEFYVCFWDMLRKPIEEYMQELYTRKKFFVNHVRGVIHLIPKKREQS